MELTNGPDGRPKAARAQPQNSNLERTANVWIFASPVRKVVVFSPAGTSAGVRLLNGKWWANIHALSDFEGTPDLSLITHGQYTKAST